MIYCHVSMLITLSDLRGSHRRQEITNDQHLENTAYYYSQD